MSKIIELQNVTIKYESTEVVSGISCVIEKGDFIGLAGPNGAGKSTLIKAILGLIPIESGKITILEQDLKSFSDWKKIGYLPQYLSSVNLLFPASVKEVILLGLLSSKKTPKITTKEDKQKVYEIMNKLDIFNLGNKMIFELSSGQRQKVMLARSLVAEPKILFFDEPSTALDPESRKTFFTFIEKLNKEKEISIIFITHDAGYIGRYANKLMYLDKKLIYFGSFSDFCKSKKMSAQFGKSNQHIICHQHH